MLYVVCCNVLPYVCIVYVRTRLCLYVYVWCMLVACYMLAVHRYLFIYLYFIAYIVVLSDSNIYGYVINHVTSNPLVKKALKNKRDNN